MKIFKETIYKVQNCTLCGDNDKILREGDVFVLNKDIKINKEQLQRLIDDKKIIHLKDKSVDTKNDNSIAKNPTVEDALKNEDKLK